MNNQQNNGVIIDLSWKFNGIVWKINGHPKKLYDFMMGGTPLMNPLGRKNNLGFTFLKM